jgi:hypothetical protein
MTIQELLESLPEEKREDMADFLYGRVPCRYGLDMKCTIETGNTDLREWAEFTEEELNKMSEWDRLRPRGSAEHDILKWGQGHSKSKNKS